MWSELLSGLTSFLTKTIGYVLAFLPSSPFRSYIDELAGYEFLGMLNWFIPVGKMSAIGSAWLVAVGTFYAYQIILRWIKAVEG